MCIDGQSISTLISAFIIIFELILLAYNYINRFGAGPLKTGRDSAKTQAKNHFEQYARSTLNVIHLLWES